MLSQKYTNSLKLIVLILLTMAAYYPAIEAEFIIDDNEFFIEDPLMTASEGLFRIWFHPTDNNQVWPYLPITRTTFWIEQQIWGFNPHISHRINIIFHLISVVCLWLALRQWLERGAWWIAMFFAIHPVYVQSVAWIAERKNVVAAVFYILCLWSYLQFEKKRLKRWYALALMLFMCALLSKTSVIMLPLILIFLRLWLQLSFKKTDYLNLLPFFLLSLGLGVLRIWFENNAFALIIDTRSALERILTAGHVPFFYLSKLGIPYPLIFTYPKWTIDPRDIFMYFPIISVIFITTILIWRYHRWGKPLFLGFGAFAVTLFPVLGFFTNAWTQFSFVADHWLHLPSIPVLILSVSGVYRLIEIIDSGQRYSLKPVFASVGMAMALIFSILTWRQTLIYKNPETLWLATITDNQESWIAHQELGRLYQADKQNQRALRHSNKALEIKNDLFRAYNNRANVHTDLGQYERAIEDYNQALKIYPGFLEAYYNRGNTYYHLKQYAQAFQDYNKALLIDPNYAKAYYNRGHVHFQLKQFQQALQDYSKVLQINPDHLEAYYNRGNTYALLKQNQQAIQDFSKVLKLNPDFVQAYHNRGLVYLLELHDPQLGCSDLKRACQLGKCESYHLSRQKNLCQ